MTEFPLPRKRFGPAFNKGFTDRRAREEKRKKIDPDFRRARAP
jgi:hypothetical protein